MRAIRFLKPWAGRCLTRVQGLSWYRRIGRGLTRGIHVGLATEDDLRALFVPAAPDEEAFLDPTASVLVAKKGRKRVGSHILLRKAHEALPAGAYWLAGLTVDAPYRGLGIGQRLLDAAIRMARGEGAGQIGLTVYEDNRSAIRLYLKAGFERKIYAAFEEKLERERISPDRRMILMWRVLEVRR